MIRYKFLTGDVNWQTYGGKFISQRLNNGNWDYWLVMDVTNLEDSMGEEAPARYLVSVNAVAPAAVSEEEKNRAIESCGWDGMEENELAMIEILNTYGIRACLWNETGNNLSKLMKAARKESQVIAFMFGFFMDRTQNAIGNDGWDFISGNIGWK
jgi:hypothetical protein